MLHRNDTAVPREAVEPADLVTEPDDEPEQYQDTRCPEPAEPHRHRTWGEEKGQPDRAEDCGPGEKGEIEGESPRPAHRANSARVASSGLAGFRHSIIVPARSAGQLAYPLS